MLLVPFGVQFLNNEEGCEMSGVQVDNVVVSGVISGVFFDNQINTKSMTAVFVPLILKNICSSNPPHL